jgi:NADH dehydrogenase
VRQLADVTITLVTPRPYMTYRPLLPEAAAGSLSPRHVVIPLRNVLPRVEILIGEATGVDPAARTATVATPATREAEQPDLELPYDVLVVAPGAVSRTLPVPGLAEHGIGFTTLEEAIGLRNHVIEQLDIAASTRNPDVHGAALTFVFVGGGYAGVEAIAELEDMARTATRDYNTLSRDDQRWILVEAGERILVEADPELGRYALDQLRARAIDVKLGTRLDSVGPDGVHLSDGSHFESRTLVWTTGTRPHPVLTRLGTLPLDEQGRLRATPTLQVQGDARVFTAGDCAAVPDLNSTPADPDPATDAPRCVPLCAPNAQHALHQARLLADNVAAHLDGSPLHDYRRTITTSMASLGLHKGVARFRGIRLTGLPAWLLHRAHHLACLPSANRRTRILSEWAVTGLFRREIVSLGSLEHPREEFRRAAEEDP